MNPSRLWADAFALYQSGRQQEASSLSKSLLKNHGGNSAALHHLGLAAFQAGCHTDAVDLLRQACLLQPESVEYRDNLAVICMHVGRFDDAAAAYREVVRLAPGHVDAWLYQGCALQMLGRLEEARDSLQRAVALKPDYAEAHYNLGNVLKTLEKYDESISCFRRAIALRPDYADAHYNLGNTLKMLERHGEAETSFRRALEINPDFAEARVGLAEIHADMGQFEAARAELSRVLAIKPEFPPAWALLAGLRKMTAEDSGWLEVALRLSDDPALVGRERIALQFAIGKYYDDTRQYDQAFSAYRTANELQRREGGSFDRTGLSAQVDTLISTYTADFVRRQWEGASPSRLPVLIVGMPRSGTSLTEQIIASHPQAFGAGELAFWGDMDILHPPATLKGHLDAAFIARVASEYEQLLRQQAPGALRVVDKMPRNFFDLGLFHIIFPQAKIIHMQRHPLDTCLSIYFQHLRQGHYYATDLGDLGFHYQEYARLMKHWRSVLPEGCLLEVPYESLTDDQPGWSRRIIEFIGLDWDERCLEFYKTDRKVGTSSNWQVKQKIYHSSRARWRNYEMHLGELIATLDAQGLLP